MDLLTYTLTTSLLILAPGPVIVVLVIRAMTAQLGELFAFTLGIIVARSLLLAMAMAGTLAWLAHYPDVVRALRWLGALSILFIAVGLWRGSKVEGGAPFATTGSFACGIALTLASPYNPALYLVIVPSLGWRVEAFPFQIVAATLGPTLVVCSAVILLGRFGRALLDVPLGPLARRGLAAMLGGLSLWIVVG